MDKALPMKRLTLKSLPKFGRMGGITEREGLELLTQATSAINLDYSNELEELYSMFSNITKEAVSMRIKYKAKVKYLKERVGVLTHNLIEAT